jgi:hypothetical protein
MTWNSGPCIGGATHWPRLNRAGFWTRPEPGGPLELVDDQADDLTDPATVDAPDTDGGDQDVPGTE